MLLGSILAASIFHAQGVRTNSPLEIFYSDTFPSWILNNDFELFGLVGAIICGCMAYIGNKDLPYKEVIAAVVKYFLISFFMIVYGSVLRNL